MYTKLSIVCFATLLLATSCSKSKESEEKKVVAYPVFEIKQKDTIISSSYVADIQAKKNIEIRSRMTGLVQNIAVSEGQFVKRGQRLFKINDAELRMELLKSTASLKQASADVNIAAIEVKQLQSLFDKNFVANNELDLSKAKLAAAKAKQSYVQAEHQAVQQKIDFTSVSAPFDGVIDIIPYKEGSLVENGALLTTLSQLDEIYAYFSIPENLYLELITDGKMGKHHKIELVLANGSTYDFSGTLKTAEGEIDRATGSIRYKVAFPNPDHLIKHGSSGKLMISEHKANAILIPQKSTFSIQDQTYVFVLDQKNAVKMRNIKIEETLRDSYIVESGLKIGDKIIYEGTQSLRDGDIVKIKAK